MGLVQLQPVVRTPFYFCAYVLAVLASDSVPSCSSLSPAGPYATDFPGKRPLFPSLLSVSLKFCNTCPPSVTAILSREGNSVQLGPYPPLRQGWCRGENSVLTGMGGVGWGTGVIWVGTLQTEKWQVLPTGQHGSHSLDCL